MAGTKLTGGNGFDVRGGSSGGGGLGGKKKKDVNWQKKGYWGGKYVLGDEEPTCTGSA